MVVKPWSIDAARPESKVACPIDSEPIATATESTGKGAIGEGILRRNVPGWLAASPLGGRILTIQPAHSRHGGDGAFYVLLRRKRA